MNQQKEPDTTIVQWVEHGINLDMARWAEQLADEVTNFGRQMLTVTQLRRFFGQAKKIQTRGVKNSQDELNMLLPELTYAVAKADNKDGILLFREKIEAGLVKVLELLQKQGIGAAEKPFNNFIKILEAIVAYHKVYYNERKNNK